MREIVRAAVEFVLCSIKTMSLLKENYFFKVMWPVTFQAGFRVQVDIFLLNYVVQTR